MNAKRNLMTSAFSFFVISLAASSGCMCIQDVCYPHGHSGAGSHHLPCHTVNRGCLRSMPIGYHPTIWQPLHAITTDYSSSESKEGLSPEALPMPAADRLVPTNPDKSKSQGELGSPSLDKLGMRYDNIDLPRTSGRKSRNEAPVPVQK